MKRSASHMDTPFATLREMVEHLDGSRLSGLIERIADIVLTVDGEGVVRDVVSRDASHDRADPGAWIGRRFEEVVTEETRGKALRLLEEARRSGAAGPRHLNHPVPGDEDLPVAYSAHAPQTGEGGGLVVLGRDLSDLAALQRQLVGAQQAMEREYERLRHMEARYRQLFHSAGEAVVVAEAVGGRVREANPAAGRLFGRDPARLAGMRLSHLFERADVPAVEAALQAAAAGRGRPVRARPAGETAPAEISASVFRSSDETLLLVRLSGGAEAGAPLGGQADSAVRLLARSPDAAAMTDESGALRWANEAFLDLAGAASSEQLIGAALEDYLGRSGVDVDVLLDSLRRQGRVRQFATVLRGAMGESAQVEVSAVTLDGAEGGGFGFLIRDMGLRAASSSASAAPPARSTEQLAALVGTAPLKDLVRESTDLIEKMCIETALEMTGGNRASAAELLGLSRQSLYSKMRRFGIGGLSH